MAATPDSRDTSGMPRRVMEAEKDISSPNVHDTSLKIQRAKEAYKEFARIEEQPTKGEIAVWYLYGLCTYFIHTVLIPIVFPLMISQIVSLPPPPEQGWTKSYRGLSCSQKEMELYQRLIHPSITVGDFKFSPLQWTSLSWAAGLILSGPILGYVATHLDHGHYQNLIFSGATAIGSLFCLPAGFFKVTWIFPPYIAAIVIAKTTATASHTRHLGLMVRGFTDSTDRKTQFSDRKAVSSWLSIYATVAGCVGSATISAFTYHMLRNSEHFISLWIVSIFSGLKWGAGIVHALSVNRPGAMKPSSPHFTARAHLLSIFKYPHAAGSLFGVLLSSFVTTCIFTGGELFAVGQLCLKPVSVLYLWLIYFIFPLLSLPLLQPLQLIIKTGAVRMQVLGFLVSAATSGVGFYYRHQNWRQHHLFLLAALQSTAAGILHAFGRVLLLDCSPPGKEGAFSVWFSWARAVGTCGGFAVAATFPGNVSRSFSVAFCSAIAGIVILIFGNISSFKGAVAAGHVRDEASEKGSPVHGLDISSEMKGAVFMEMGEERRMGA